MNDHERTLRSEKARMLLEDATFKEAVAGVEKAAIESMISAKTDDERRRAADFVIAVRSVSAQLRSWQMDGKMIAAKQANNNSVA